MNLIGVYVFVGGHSKPTAIREYRHYQTDGSSFIYIFSLYITSF